MLLELLSYSNAPLVLMRLGTPVPDPNFQIGTARSEYRNLRF
jgi:hypothetical protein